MTTAWLFSIQQAHPSASRKWSPAWISAPRDASAASNKHSSIQTALHSVLLLLVAAKCYAKCCSATGKYSAGMQQSRSVQESISERESSAIALRKSAAETTQRVNIYRSPRQRRDSPRTLPGEISRRASTFIHFNGGFSHWFKDCDFHMSRNILVPCGPSGHKNFPV